MVGLTELESVTSSMSTRHSNHLSYNPTSLFKTGAIINAELKIVKKNFSAGKVKGRARNSERAQKFFVTQII